MVNMFIIPGVVETTTDADGNSFYDISCLDYREVNIIDIYDYTGEVNSQGHVLNFEGAASYTSDYFSYEILETAFIAIAPNQKTNYMTDVLVLHFGGDNGVSFTITSKMFPQLAGGNASSIYTRPWLLSSYNGLMGFIGTNNRGNPWDYKWNFLYFANYTTGKGFSAFYPLTEARVDSGGNDTGGGGNTPDVPEEPVVADWRKSFLVGLSMGLCGKPLPIVQVMPEPDKMWEVLFDGNLTTEASDNANGAGVGVRLGVRFQENEIIRLSVNSVPKILATVKRSENSYYIGNEWLSRSDGASIPEDTGYDYYFSNITVLGVMLNSFYSRYPGTYSVKIERRIPAAYLYNGVRLPKLPEWDKGAYPYALISDRYSLEPTLVLTSAPLSTPVEATFGQNFVKVANECQYMRYILENNAWVIYTAPTTLTGASEGYDDLVWSSYDIPNVDNSVYLAASEPVPVYE